MNAPPKTKSRSPRLAVLLLLLAASPMAMAAGPCTTPGCFEATLSGQSNESVSGTARLARLPDGGLRLALLAVGKPDLTMILTRDDTGTMAGEQRYAIGPRSCGDESADTDDDVVRDLFVVGVRLGPLAAPQWMGVAHSGFLTLSKTAEGGINGRFELTACGEELRSGAESSVALKGSFRAPAARKP